MLTGQFKIQALEKLGPKNSMLSLPHEDDANTTASVVRVKNLHVRYGPRTALYDVSLDVKPQELVVLIGPNGSGKSTLLRTLAGFIKAIRGEIRFGQTELNALAPHERARLGISYFMQGGRIFPSLTVEENIELAAEILPKAERRRNTELVLHLFPYLIGLSHRYAGVLSGGERQALALVITLVRKPRLLLLDEPSAGLSASVSNTLMEKLREIKGEWDLSVLLVEQNIEAALRIADRVVAIVNGRAINLEAERPETLLSSNRLNKIFFGSGQPYK